MKVKAPSRNTACVLAYFIPLKALNFRLILGPKPGFGLKSTVFNEAIKTL
jgi:hypothetical protein